jgi:hypothetical protein
VGIAKALQSNSGRNRQRQRFPATQRLAGTHAEPIARTGASQIRRQGVELSECPREASSARRSSRLDPLSRLPWTAVMANYTASADFNLSGTSFLVVKPRDDSETAHILPSLNHERLDFRHRRLSGAAEI